MGSTNRKELFAISLLSHLGMYRLARDIRRWQVIVIVGAFLASGVQCAVGETVSPSSQPTSPMLKVDFQNGLLSIDAKEGPWKKVLSDIQTKTGISLHVSMPLTGAATVSFKDLPIEQGLKRLFGPDANFAIFYRKQDANAPAVAVPYEVWVIGKGSGEAPTDPVQAVAKEFDQDLKAAQRAAVISQNHELRLKAIATLGQHANRMAMDTLLKISALDRRAELDIQQGAENALRNLVKNNPHAREIMTTIVEGSGPPAVQQLAADILGVQLNSADDENTEDSGE